MSFYLVYHYRGGSTLLQRLIQDSDLEYPGSASSFWIPTRPQKQVGCVSTLNPCHGQNNIIYRSHLPIISPQFVISRPVSLGPTVHLVRNPVGMISSQYYLNRGWELNQRITKPEAFWLSLCNGYKQMIDQADACTGPDYYRIYFNDLVTKPLETIEKMFQYWGIAIDLETVQHNWEIMNRPQDQKRHSSFGDSDFTSRDERWEPWQQEIFERIMQ